MLAAEWWARMLESRDAVGAWAELPNNEQRRVRRAIKRALGDHAYSVAISSPKSMVGHLLGAAGAISALTGIGAIRENVIPPTINLDNPDLPECDLDYVPNVAREARVDTAMVNGFGFGGQNAVAVFRRFEP